jgi:hypothetical protein
MTKFELMNYCWCRDFDYADLLSIAERSGSADIPNEAEYSLFSIIAHEDMEKFYVKSCVDDQRSVSEKAKQELGINVEDCDR